MEKVEQFENLKAEYINAYEVVNKRPCPEIVKAKAWIKVGDISFRPDDFEKAVNTLKLRCSSDVEVKKDVESKLATDLVLLNETKDSLIQSFERLRSLTLCDGTEIENMKEMIEKCQNLIDVAKKRNVI